MKFKPIFFIGTILCVTTPVFLQEKFNIADSINKFSVELLQAVHLEGGDSLNIALSPLTIWTLLTVISEGARDATLEEIVKVLRQPQDRNTVRDSYQKLSRLLQVKSREAEFESSSGIFANQLFPVSDKFSQVVNKYYDTSITPVNFKNNNQQAANIINRYVAQATKNRIPVLVSPGDVQNAYVFITTTMYFKGQWQTPFNRTATQRAPFLDEKRNEIGQVNMMHQAYPFAYARLDSIRTDALELPYGFDDKFSMLVLVPRGTQTVTNMLSGLTRESITDILAVLKRNHQMFMDEDVHIYIPKFKIVSDFNLDRVLDTMGIKDVFDSSRANLLGIFPHYLFLSRIIQKAEIDVDEEGTVAASAGGAIFLNRAPPPIVRANRPFLYFIIHKESGTIIFAGKLSDPNTLQV